MHSFYTQTRIFPLSLIPVSSFHSYLIHLYRNPRVRHLNLNGKSNALITSCSGFELLFEKEIPMKKAIPENRSSGTSSAYRLICFSSRQILFILQNTRDLLEEPPSIHTQPSQRAGESFRNTFSPPDNFPCRCVDICTIMRRCATWHPFKISKCQACVKRHQASQISVDFLRQRMMKEGCLQCCSSDQAHFRVLAC